MKFISLLVVLLLAQSAMAQMTVEEAEARLKIRQAARAATTRPTTRPTTMPAAWAAVLQEDADRDSQLSVLVQQKPKGQGNPVAGLVFTPGTVDYSMFNHPSFFGLRRSRDRDRSDNTNTPGRVWVDGHFRSDGTYVRGHYRDR
jgi:hypothetical protein